MREEIKEVVQKLKNSIMMVDQLEIIKARRRRQTMWYVDYTLKEVPFKSEVEAVIGEWIGARVVLEKVPEGTKINPKHGNIVDEKTGYGIFISFSINPHCISKKVNNREYGFFFDKNDTSISKIAKEIMRVNGFKNTCK